MSEEQVASESVESVESSGDWTSGISEELRAEPMIQNLGSLEDLAKGYVHAQHMIGSDKVVIPGKTASEDEYNDFYNALGRPDTPNGYTVPTENMPDIKMDESLQNEFFEESHRLGLTDNQVAGLMRWQAEKAFGAEKQAFEAQEMSVEDSIQKLQSEFGDAYDEKIALAQEAVYQFGGDELMDYLDSSGIGNSPQIIKAFAEIGKMIASDEIIGGGGRQSFRMSPGDAKIAIDAKRRDQNFMAAYTNRDAPGHQGAVDEMTKLHDIAYPEETY